MSSFEICEIFKETFFSVHLLLSIDYVNIYLSQYFFQDIFPSGNLWGYSTLLLLWFINFNRSNLINEQKQLLRKVSCKNRYSSKQLFNRVSSWLFTEIAIVGALYRKVFLEISQNSLENSSATISFLIKLQAFTSIPPEIIGGIEVKACNFIKKESLAQVFSSEFCEISKNTFSKRTPPVAASAQWLINKHW